MVCIGCTSVVQCERTVVLRSAEMRNFSAADCRKGTRGNVRNVPPLIFLDNFLHSAIRIPQNTCARPMRPVWPVHVHTLAGAAGAWFIRIPQVGSPTGAQNDKWQASKNAALFSRHDIFHFRLECTLLGP